MKPSNRAECPDRAILLVTIPASRSARPDYSGGANGSAGGLSWRKPVLASDDAHGAFGQFHGRLAVVGAVTYLIAKDALRFAFVAFRGGDRG
jgi:hypothetical protein